MARLASPVRPQFTNLVDVLHDSVERHRDRPLFGVLSDGDVTWKTYGEFMQLVDRFRAGLASLGVSRGDKVAVISNNRLEWAVGCYACYGLGAAYVPMYEAQRDEERQYILGDSQAAVCLVSGSDIEERVRRMQPALPRLRHVVNFDADASEPTSYAALMARDEHVPAVTPDASDLAQLIYTSGTTGKPKGVMLTHGNLGANINSFLEIVDVGSDDRGLAFLPWAHVFGGGVELNLAVATGGSTAILSDATQLLDYLPVVQPTVLFAVPRVWNKIYAGVTHKMSALPDEHKNLFFTGIEAKKKQLRGEDVTSEERAAAERAEETLFPLVRQKLGGNLRFAVSGAAALARDVAEFMFALGIEVHEGYGLTETGGGCTAQPSDAVRIGSVGKALPGVRLELDKSVPAAVGEDEGELIIYGRNVMHGYHNRDDETRASLTEDGGFRTGDLARIDDEGYVYITGRAKELYKLENGKYVAPVPIEQRLERSPYVAQAIVTGENKRYNVALIIPDMPALQQWAEAHGLSGQGDELLAHSSVRSLFESEVERCNSEGKGYERIAGFLIDTEELTPHNGMLTPTLKPKRRAILARYGEDLESLYGQTEADRPVPRASYIRELQGGAARDKAKTA